MNKKVLILFVVMVSMLFGVVVYVVDICIGVIIYKYDDNFMFVVCKVIE